MINIKEILKDWLESHGFDGLTDADNVCGCNFDDFMPCGEVYQDCKAAYKHKNGLMYEKQEEKHND